MKQNRYNELNRKIKGIETYRKYDIDKPYIVAGPCSAESEAQLLTIASQLSESGNIEIFRAGIWKPRTGVNTFQGIGEKGLKWLKHVEKEIGLMVATEVASPDHVNICLQNDIKAVWIGSRTTVNPLLVQAIANSLKNHKEMIVLVKNPICPQLDLWIGAIERFINAGLVKIIAVHRGFHCYHQTRYRNQPFWEIPLELKKKFPKIPLICDPSHIAGRRVYVSEVATKALNCNMAGLMIEVHNNPQRALSDPQQQITPAALQKILRSHKTLPSVRRPLSNSSQLLSYYRSKIDNIDLELILLLSKRTRIIKKIGNIKKRKNLSAYQPDRFDDMIKMRELYAFKLEVNKSLVNDLFSMLQMYAIDEQI